MVIDGPDELETLMSPPGLKEAVAYAGQRLERARPYASRGPAAPTSP